MNSRKWILLFFSLSSILIAAILYFNYIVDPYGYQSRENKFIRNLSEVTKTNIIHNRLISDGDYYLIGTSRMVRLDPYYIEKISNKKTHNIHIDGSTLKENYMLAQYVKYKKKNFIYGFDAFSLNENRLKHQEIRLRYQTYKKGLSHSANFFTQYFSADLLSASLKHQKDVKKGKNFFLKHTEEDKRTYSYSIEAVNKEQGYDNQDKKKNFSNYKAYEKIDIVKLAKLGTKDDKFIIFPKHYYNYILFEKYQNINTLYLESIKTLVKNTDAEVWSFYQINELTKNMNNFDGYGWHFKPKIGRLIFDKIFNPSKKPNKFGILLTKDNVDIYIKSIKQKIINLSIYSND